MFRRFFYIIVDQISYQRVRSVLLVIVLFLSFTALAANPKYDRYLSDFKSLLIEGESIEAEAYLKELKEDLDKDNSIYWLVKSNMEMGTLKRKQGDYGKAIIYNLEGLRFAKKEFNPNLIEDVARMHNACGAIFKKFKAYKLSEEYFLKGLSVVRQGEKEYQITSDLLYNLAGLYNERGEYEKAIEILSESLVNFEIGSRDYFDFSNRLSIVYKNSNNYKKSIDILEDLLLNTPVDNIVRRGRYFHNLAKSYRLSEDYESAELNYNNAIRVKGLSDDNRKLFSSYFGLGQTYLQQKMLVKAEINFNKAEELYEKQPQHPDYFELFKYFSDLNFNLKNYNKSKYYEDLYIKNLNEYLDTKEKLQETDQRYNMDLITKRYFDEVNEQERVANILFYSKLSSGGLLTLLLLVIGYYQYQRITTRKSLEKELVALKLVK